MSGFYTVLQDNLHDSMRTVLDEIGYPTVPIAFANENVLEPSKTYCVIDILLMTQMGRTNEASFIVPEMPEGLDILETMTHYTLLTQVSFIGKDSGLVAPDFKHNISNNRKCYEEFYKMNFGILTKSDLRRNPQKRETEWVDSFNMDLNLSFAIRTRQSYDWVEFITVNDEVFRIWNDE